MDPVTDPVTTDPAAPPSSEAAPIELSKLLALLGLPESAGQADVEAKIAELTGAVTTATDASTALASANAELEKVRAEYQALYEREQIAAKQKTEAEVDAILEQFADRLKDDKGRAALRNILLSDRESGLDILNGLPAAVTAPVASTEAPPAPMHNPDAPAVAPSAADKAAQSEALIKAVQKEGKFPKYAEAREEARRRDPSLFS